MLYYFEGMTDVEIGKLFNTSRSTIPKCEDCSHKSCLQPFAYILVHAKKDVSALVVELPH